MLVDEIIFRFYVCERGLISWKWCGVISIYVVDEVVRLGGI